MRIALPTIEKLIIRKADEAKTLSLFDADDDAILSSEEVCVSSEDELVNVLKERAIDVFICLSLSSKLVIDLAMADIEIIGGIRGKAEKAVKDYLLGELEGDDFTLDCESGSCNGDCSHCY